MSVPIDQVLRSRHGDLLTIHGQKEKFAKSFSISVMIRKQDIDHERFEKHPICVVPAQAGIQKFLKRTDSRFYENDKLLPGFERNSKI